MRRVRRACRVHTVIELVARVYPVADPDEWADRSRRAVPARESQLLNTSN